MQARKYPNLKHIVSHAKLDPDRRSDPGTNFNWERFKELVLDTSREPLSTIPPAAFTMDHPALRGRKNASLEEEEANFALEDAAEKRLHETASDRINF